MVRERVVQRVLWALTAVLVVAGVLSAAIVGAGDGGDEVVTSSSSTTTAQAGDSGAPVDAGAGGVTTTPGAPPGGGAPSGGSAPGTPAAPGSTAPQAQPQSPSQPQQSGGFREVGSVDTAGATQVPAAGTYSYRLTDGSGEGHDASTVVEDKGSAAGARRLVVTFRGESVDLVHDALWGPEQVRYAKTTFTYGGSQFECDWQPDYVVMPLGLSRGATWEAKSSCTVQAGATTAVLSRTTTSKVADARRVQVAGGEVLTWVIESNDRLEFPGQGALDTKETSWFAPKLGVAVRQVVETSGSDGDDGGRTEMVITRLTPA